MSVPKMSVHNEMEANALIKECANPDEFDGTHWVTHRGESLFVTKLYQGFTLRKWKHTYTGMQLIGETQ